MDTCFRFAGAEGATCEVVCSSQRLCEVSPLLRQALDPDPDDAFLATAQRDARGRTVLTLANPCFSTQAFEDAVAVIMHYTPGGSWASSGWVSGGNGWASGGSGGALRRLRTLWVLDWLQALDQLHAFVADVMEQMPSLATDLGPAGFVATHLADLPRAALDAAPGLALSRLAKVLAADGGGRHVHTVLEDLCDMLRVFDTAAPLAPLTERFNVRVVLDWVAATKQPPADAARLALLRCPPVLVVRWLAARRVLTRELFDSVVTANMHRMALPDFAALACFTPLAAEAHPHLVRLALQQQNTAVQLQDGKGRRVISIKMRAEIWTEQGFSSEEARRGAVRVGTALGSLVTITAEEDEIDIRFGRINRSIAGYDVFALADKSSTVFTSVTARPGDHDGTGSRVILHNDSRPNALGTGNRYVLLVPCAAYWAA
jgi:hypothetical protein